MKSLKDAIYDTFMLRGVDYSEMSVDDIALEISVNDPEYKDVNPDDLKRKVIASMNNAVTKTVKGKRVEDKNSLYERVKNGKGGYKKGVYKLRKPKKKKPRPNPTPVIVPNDNPTDVETNFLGTAGEMSVCGELLFLEYNVSRMSVDDGIDIVAMKNNKTFYIQVKTVQVRTSGFGVKIRTKSYNRYNGNDCYYIVVARGSDTKFIVATADDIRRLVAKNEIAQGEAYLSIRFTQNMGKLFIGSEDIEYMINSFDRIK